VGRDAGLSAQQVEIFVVGSSQAVASADVRERLHVDLDEFYAQFGALLSERGVVEEAVALATCGRLELYCVARDADRAMRLLTRLFARRTGLDQDELRQHSYALRGPTAVRHLFRVASGLESVVHGEAQILGQVREAAHDPLTERSKGPILHRLFEHALQTGKKVRTDTEVGRGAASLASAAVDIVRQEMGKLGTRSVLILGAGDTGRLIATLLKKAGVGRMVVANRTRSVAEEVAGELGAEAADLSDVVSLMEDADLVVGAVTLGEWLVRADMVRAHRERPRYFLDLAHPRNIDPAVGALPGARLLDLEHVFGRVETARDARAAQVPLAEAIVKSQAEAFMRWFRARPAVGVLRAVRRQVLQRAEEEADRYARGRSEREREEMRRFARSLARSLLHSPTVALRDADPSGDEGRALLDSATALFGVDRERR